MKEIYATYRGQFTEDDGGQKKQGDYHSIQEITQHWKDNKESDYEMFLNDEAVKKARKRDPMALKIAAKAQQRRQIWVPNRFKIDTKTMGLIKEFI